LGGAVQCARVVRAAKRHSLAAQTKLTRNHFALSAICVILEATKDTSVAAFLRDRAATESDPELRDEILDCLRANTAV